MSQPQIAATPPADPITPFGFKPVFERETGFLSFSTISWLPEGTAACPSLDCTSNGVFNFNRIMPRDDTAESRVFQPDYSTWHISNACPSWVEFSLRD